MAEIKIRKASLSDAEILAKLSYKTFYDAFYDHPKNAPDDIESYMNKAFSLETIEAELAEPDSIFIIAGIDDEIAGYAKLMLGSIEEPVKAENPVELNRIYSHQKFLGKGVGRALLDECFRIAEHYGCDQIWLGVWELNPRAQAFYRKHGFNAVGKHIFQLGTDPQTDLIMVKPL